MKSTESNNIDIYHTIENSEIAEIKIKGSKFIANVASAPDKEIAQEFLDKIRAKYFDATHNCFAYKIGANSNEFRYSDDGEPNGSAGKPIFFAISKFEYSDIILVVTRYFGGTKLGVGGLVRAYSDAAEAVLSICKRKEVHITTPVQVKCTYEDINTVKRILSEYAVSMDEVYTDRIEIIANIHSSRADNFCQDIYKHTNGKVISKILS